MAKKRTRNKESGYHTLVLDQTSCEQIERIAERFGIRGSAKKSDVIALALNEMCRAIDGETISPEIDLTSKVLGDINGKIQRIEKALRIYRGDKP